MSSLQWAGSLRQLLGLTVVALALLIVLAVIVKRMPGAPLNVVTDTGLRTHFMLDYEYFVDEDTGDATMGHLVVLNPGDSDADLTVTAYFEDRAPASFSMVAPAGSSTESNYTRWPVEEGQRFALRVESSVPVFCQATIGWNNTANDYGESAVTPSPNRRREVAKSYASITSLADRWFVADGYIIDKPGRTWVGESEWLILLNPHPEDLTVTLTTYSHGEKVDHAIMVGAERVSWTNMGDLAPHNQHYGARLAGDRGFAAQWVRVVTWESSNELMTYWSVPLTALSTRTERAGELPDN
jgi:hypothetical protein